MKKYFFLIVSVFVTIHAFAQNDTVWNHKKCAVVLTYDDGYNQQLDNAIPVLDSLGLKATFYLSASFPGVRMRLNDWRNAANKGHELGNHTIYHPCVGGNGREWVKPDYDLRNYTVQRMVDEIRMTNLFLESLDGKKKRTFAFPCADTKIHDTSYIDGLRNDFIAARNVRAEMHTIDKIDLSNVDCYMVNGETADQMIEWVKKAMQTRSLLVTLFHGVGGGNALNVALPEHRRFLEYLQQNQKDIWVAPMLDIAEYVTKYQTSSSGKQIDNIKGLKDYYKDYFPIGVSVSPRSLKTDEAQLILQQFNSMTPENAMKMGPIHPAENEYNWRGADSIVAFAKRNNIKLRGHTLCWHNQTPDWLFKDTLTKTIATKEVLLQRLKDHITAVVKRYKGAIYAWDVVNEAISDKPGEYFRPSLWYQICGEDFIAKAFQYAHEADPGALLFYNDYNEINPVKREKIIRMIKGLLAAGVPINGVGLQGHWALNEPSKDQLEKTLEDFSQLGLKLQITELDISVYPKEHNARERKPEDSDTSFTEDKEAKQTAVYKMCFELFRKYKNVITGVTFWNISDRDSWLDNFPVRGRKDYPLLFDKDLKPKKSFWEVVKF